MNLFDDPAKISALIFIVVAVVLVALFFSKKTKKEFDTLKNFLNGRIIANFFSIKFVGDYKGSLFEIKQIPGGKNTPPKIKLKMRTLQPLSVKIQKHFFIFSWLEKLGLIRKSIKTNDIQFDETFRVSAPSDMRIVSFLSSVENRKLIQDLFKADFASFKIEKGSIEILKTYHSLEDELKQENLLPALEALYKLALA